MYPKFLLLCQEANQLMQLTLNFCGHPSTKVKNKDSHRLQDTNFIGKLLKYLCLELHFQTHFLQAILRRASW
jgi:hypothetical protein